MKKGISGLLVVLCVVLLPLTCVGETADFLFDVVVANRLSSILNKFPGYSIQYYAVFGDNQELIQTDYRFNEGQVIVDYSSREVYVGMIYNDAENYMAYYPETNDMTIGVNATGKKYQDGNFNALDYNTVYEGFIGIEEDEETKIIATEMIVTDEDALFGLLESGSKAIVKYVINTDSLLLQRIETYKKETNGALTLVEKDIYTFGTPSQDILNYLEVFHRYQDTATEDKNLRNITVNLTDEDGNSTTITKVVLKGLDTWIDVPDGYQVYTDKSHTKIYNRYSADRDGNLVLYAHYSVDEENTEYLSESEINENIERGVYFFIHEEYEKAIEFFTSSIDSLDISSQNMLAKSYYYIGNNDQAFIWDKKVAEQGNAEAECNLGIDYLNGIGTEPDESEGFIWLSKAADQGYPYAQYVVAYCYENGIGVGRNIAKAIDYYELAAQQGEENAEYTLAIYYENGNGVKQDVKKALDLYIKAADHGVEDAQEYLISYYFDENINDIPKGIYWSMRSVGIDDDLTSHTADELNALIVNAEEAIKLYHTSVRDVEETTLNATKQIVEEYYRKQGIQVSWPHNIFGSVIDTEYQRDWDLYRIKTYVGYKDSNNQDVKVDVFSALFPTDYQYKVCYLILGEDVVLDRRNELPEKSWITKPIEILNGTFNIDLAQMSYGELITLKSAASKEIKLHDTTNSETDKSMQAMVKERINNYFGTKNIAVSWPGSGDFKYAKDRGLYALTTHIDYKDSSGNNNKEDVYAEAWPEDDDYRLIYLSVGDYTILNERSLLPAYLSEGSKVIAPTPIPTETPAVTPRYTPAPTPGKDVIREFLGTKVNTGLDNGYSGHSEIGIDDPHYGWDIGKFYVSGFTRKTTLQNTDAYETIFLKNVDDVVTLWFNCEQDIDALDGKNDMKISEDINGYDQYFSVKRTNFKRGTLIIRHRDFQNDGKTPVIYTDYLAASVKKGADTQVRLCDEGDYEVALDYEIKDKNNLFGINTTDRYNNYRIFFRFSVRNGNCMVYLRDVATKSELLNTAITENGFYIDLVRSRYLDIDVKYSVLVDNGSGIVEDARFNRPAKDNDEYTKEGIYTISVKNRYTGESTTKTLFVGSQELLNQYKSKGFSEDRLK